MLIHNYFVFDGKPSTDFGVGISGSGTFRKSHRRLERFTVPGRNGTLTISDGTFEDVELVYPAYFVEEFPVRFDALTAWLYSKKGMVRLEDTYHPEHFRLGEFAGDLDPDMGTLNRSGRFDLTFNCDGRKFLKSGERISVYSAEHYELSHFFEDVPGQKVIIVNPTPFDSKPVLYMRGSGTLIVNGVTMEIEGNRAAAVPPEGYYRGMAGAWAAIDCDTEEVYDHYSGESWNSAFVIDGAFPMLKPGENYVQSIDALGNEKADFAIMPRWYVV